MSLLPLVYYAKSDAGKQGYVMSLEMAKLIGVRERPPDAQKGGVEQSKMYWNTNGRQKVKTRYIGD